MRLILPAFLIYTLLFSSCKPNLDKYKDQNKLYEKFVVGYLFHSLRYEELWLPALGKEYLKLAYETDTLCNEYFSKSFLVKDFKTSVKDFQLLQQKVLEILSIKEAFQTSQTNYFIEQTKLVKPIEDYDALFTAYLKLKSYSFNTIRSGITTCGMSPTIFEIDTLKKNKSITICAYLHETRSQFPIEADVLSISQNGQSLAGDARICNKPSLMSINLPLTTDTSAIQLVTSYIDSFSDSLKIDTFLFSTKRIYKHPNFGRRNNK